MSSCSYNILPAKNTLLSSYRMIKYLSEGAHTVYWQYIWGQNFSWNFACLPKINEIVTVKELVLTSKSIIAAAAQDLNDKIQIIPEQELYVSSFECHTCYWSLVIQISNANWSHLTWSFKMWYVDTLERQVYTPKKHVMLKNACFSWDTYNIVLS